MRLIALSSDKTMAFHQLRSIFAKQQEVNKLLQEIREDLGAPLNFQYREYQDDLQSRGHDLADGFDKRQQTTANRIKESFAKLPVDASRAYHCPTPPSNKSKTCPRFQRKVKPLTEPAEYKSSLMPKTQKELLEKMATLQMQVCYEADKVFSSLQSLEDSSCTVKKTESSSSSLSSTDSQTPPELRALPFLNTPQVDKIKRKSGYEDRPTPQNILNFLAVDSEQWKKKIAVLRQIQYLAEHRPDTVIENLHKFSDAVRKEAMNHRSAVAREAIVTLGHLSEHLKGNMNSVLKHITAVLLYKSMDTNRFICDEVSLALSKIVQNCSTARVMNALIEKGLSHQNTSVRICTARHLKELAEKLGPDRFARGPQNLTGCFLDALSRLAVDSTLEVRSYAKSTLTFLSTNEHFLHLVDKFANPKNKSVITYIIAKARHR